MNGYSTRQMAITAINNYVSTRPSLNFTETSPTELFGSNVFSDKVMRERLPRDVYRLLRQTIEDGEKMDPAIAGPVAAAMKDWALSKGATHYTHVFYPLTGLTAEKHDGFLMPDGQGGAITEFDARLLIQGEPDASSFPSGGLRATFEARGYTVWDVTNPAYIQENPNGTVLCIPTAFISWTGEALDKKTPLLRSNQALSVQAQRLLRLFGHDHGEHVRSFVGPEQEYFLIDRNFYFARPDLYLAGCTLFGAPAPKGQAQNAHYFGAIPPRILSYMMEVEHVLYKLGVPVTTRHNEVAPGQFEIAPLYEVSNLATDHNQIIMTVLKDVASKNGLACLLHEKPFAGVNGSGKHINYSLGTKTLGNLFDPGDAPHDNMQFLLFCAAAVRGVHLHGDLLRAVVASAGNDHRLGANEAPPAVLSLYLGKQLTDILFQIQKKGCAQPEDLTELKTDVETLPALLMDAGDRNRTSPFAFTGNRFEFRATGSSGSIAGPQVVLNTLFAESLDYISTLLEKAVESGQSVESGACAIIREIMDLHGKIIFNGDGYTEAWKREAQKRGLPNLESTMDALPVLTQPDVIALFESFEVFTRRELEGRQEVYLEQYIQTIEAEAAIALQMIRATIVPAGIRYQKELAQAAAALQTVGQQYEMHSLKEVSLLLAEIQESARTLEALLDKSGFADLIAQGRHFGDTVFPCMQGIRTLVDRLETLIPDDLWPLPSYQEMMFIK